MSLQRLAGERLKIRRRAHVQRDLRPGQVRHQLWIVDGAQAVTDAVGVKIEDGPAFEALRADNELRGRIPSLRCVGQQRVQ